MTTAQSPCPVCGARNAEGARFCSTCGTALTAGDASARRETRKTVTVLFAVMAVFGMPTAHEDDALRAVRAAAGIRDRLLELNAELQATRGIEIRFRTGVNTGEVVAGHPATADSFVTGDTVNTAARLEQNA